MRNADLGAANAFDRLLDPLRLKAHCGSEPRENGACHRFLIYHFD
jgi:hypothetical protein